MLAAVIVTSLIVCVFPFAGGIKSDKISIAIVVLQAALVAVAVVVVFQLDNPFTGPLATTPDPLTAVATLVGARVPVGHFRFGLPLLAAHAPCRDIRRRIG